MYPLEFANDNLRSLMYNGSVRAAFPPLAGVQAQSTEKDIRLNPEEIMDSIGTASAMNNNFRGDAMWLQIMDNERIGDMVAGVSQNTMGAGSRAESTATERSIIAAGVQTHTEDRISIATADLPRMVSLAMFIAATMREQLAVYYGEDEVPPMDALMAPISWDVNGKSALQTPQARREAAQVLIPVVEKAGGDLRELARIMLANSPLRGSEDKILPQQSGSPLATELLNEAMVGTVGAAGGNGPAGQGQPAQGLPSGSLGEMSPTGAEDGPLDAGDVAV